MRKVYLLSKGSQYNGNWTFFLDTAFTSRKTRQAMVDNILKINQAENIVTDKREWDDGKFGCEPSTFTYYDGENGKYRGCIKLHELILTT